MKNRKGHIYKRGATFWLQYDVDGIRKRESLGTKDKGEARRIASAKMTPLKTARGEDIATLLRDQAAKIEHAELEAIIVPLSNVWNLYLTSNGRPDSGPHTLEGYRKAWADFVEHLIEQGYQNMRQVPQDAVGAYVTTLRGSVKANTFNKKVRALSLVWKVVGGAYGISNIIPIATRDNPHAITLKKVSRDRVGFRRLSDDELVNVLKHAGEYRTLIMLGIYTGLRLHDCACLRVNEVKLDKGVIVRCAEKTKHSSGKVVFSPIFAPLHDELSAVLNGTEYVQPELAARYDKDRTSLSKSVARVFRKAGVETTEDGKVGFHSLRHTWASLMAESGVQPSVVQANLGHSSPAMTEYYSHVDEDRVAKFAGATGRLQLGGK